MNSMYFTEEHELFRQSFRDFLHKEVVPHIENGKKQEQLSVLFGRNSVKWAFLD